MRLIHKCCRTFANINTQFIANKAANAVRFESQNVNWDQEEVNYQSMAFAKGLKTLSFGENDNILLRVSPAHQSQSYVAKLGSAIINANLILSRAQTIEELDRELASNKVKAMIFEPTLPVGSDLAIDAVYQLMPEIKNLVQGSQIKPQNYPDLSLLLQTNFYSYPGVFKYKSVLNYASDENFSIPLSSQHEPLPLPNSNKPIVITEPAHDFAFRAATMNSLVNGRYVICAEPSQVGQVSDIYEGNIDLIATEEVSVDDSVSVYVEKGSRILAQHPKRTQL